MELNFLKVTRDQMARIRLGIYLQQLPVCLNAIRTIDTLRFAEAILRLRQVARRATHVQDILSASTAVARRLEIENSSASFAFASCPAKDVIIFYRSGLQFPLNFNVNAPVNFTRLRATSRKNININTPQKCLFSFIGFCSMSALFQFSSCR